MAQIEHRVNEVHTKSAKGIRLFIFKCIASVAQTIFNLYGKDDLWVEDPKEMANWHGSTSATKREGNQEVNQTTRGVLPE